MTQRIGERMILAIIFLVFICVLLTKPKNEQRRHFEPENPERPSTLKDQ
jgi:hypothetical protein